MTHSLAVRMRQVSTSSRRAAVAVGRVGIAGTLPVAHAGSIAYSSEWRRSTESRKCWHGMRTRLMIGAKSVGPERTIPGVISEYRLRT